MSGMTAIIWIATGILLVVVVVMLISRAVKSGKNPGVPTTSQYDTQDAPPADSERVPH